MPSLSTSCTPESVRIVTSTVAAMDPVLVRPSQIADAPEFWPVPTNHMSAAGWAHLTVPVPLAVASSASKPDAIVPVASICVAPDWDAWGAGPTNAVSGVVTVVAASAPALAPALAPAFPLVLAADPAAAVAAEGIEVRVAEPLAACEPLATCEPEPECAPEPDGAEATAMLAVPVFGAGGGQDRVTAVTA